MASQDFDIDQLAAYLHLTPPQVEKLANRGNVPGRKVGGAWRFSQADIHHWLEDKIGLSDEAELVQVESVLDRQSVGEEEEVVSIAGMLRPETIKTPLSGKSPRKIIVELCDLATEAGLLWDPEKMSEAVLARENMHTTALDNGVALLHPRRPLPDIISEGFLCLGRTYQGVPFGGSRGILTDVFFLIASVDDRTHLRTLARLSRIIGDSAFYTKLRDAADPITTIEMIQEFEEDL
ncbi:PTS sugar transporter subunit IIA [Blastopirellula retiformator]|uniref:PTS system fructose-specific EIIABC component n=1 Tax=Blastopirellula retiformator TaxID=2527970 RepID=A0A5C5V8Q8_9BACT|nr:PTS sugar transporter subunit IIA [Blastopirellula retiformator]TWT34237.1 PTS system fructose-specific EIIABC component [Blastopirellula retiformator]